MAIQALAPLSRTGQAEVSTRVGSRIGLACGAILADVALALLIARSERGVFALLAVVVFVAIVGACIIAPRQVLFGLAVLWGLLHSILLDFQLFDVAGVSVSLSRGLGVVLVVGLGILLLARTPETRGLPIAVPLRALLIFTLLFLIAVPIGPSGVDGGSDFVRVASGVLIGVAAFLVIDTRQRLLQLSRLAVISGAAVAAVTIAQFLLLRVSPGTAAAIFGSSFYERSYDVATQASAVRVGGPVGAPGETAGFLLVSLAFGLLRYSLLRDGATQRPRLFWLLLISCGVLATLTRAGIAAMLILVLAWAAQDQLRSVSLVAIRARVLALVAVVALLAVPFLGAENVSSRLSDVNPATSGANFAQGRASVWGREVAMLRTSSPVQLLIGHGAHSSYLLTYRGGLTPDRISPHNLMLWLLVETGLIGAVVYLVFLFGLAGRYLSVSQARRFAPEGKVAAVALAALLAYTAQDMFTLSVGSAGHRWHFMLFVGATLRACTPLRAFSGTGRT
jgi:hypothetical protein